MQPTAWAVGPLVTTALAVTSGGSAVTTVAAGSVVILTATVAAGGTAVTPGLVLFCDATAANCTDIHLLGQAQLGSTGTATFKLVPGIGSHSYKAIFAGTNSYAASTSTTSALTVTGAYATSTALAASGSVGSYSLTATVTGVGSLASAPTGNVSFLDMTNNNGLLGTAALNAADAGFGLGSAANPSPAGAIVAVGDFNGDGLADLVSGDDAGNLTVSLGNGDGTFRALTAAKLLAYTYIQSIATGDFNSDGKLDLAVVGTSNNVTVLLGNGDGTFTIASTPLVGQTPVGIVVGDWNGDGIPDLAVSNSQDSNVTVLLGNGNGTFAGSAHVSTSTNPGPIAAGDFNGDGKPDLAVLTLSNYTVTIFLSNGDGTFVAVSTRAVVGLDIASLAVADFNGDGKADIAVTDGPFDSVSIYLGNGNGTFSGTFASSSSPAAGDTPGQVAVGDFNGDGIADLAVVSENSNGNSGPTVLLGKGDGTFTTYGAFPGNYSNSLAAADFNGDGETDIVYVNGYTASGTSPLTVMLAQGGLTASAGISNVSPIGSGTHQVKASYAGTTNFGSSVSATTGLTAQMMSPSLSLNAQPTSSSYGQQTVLFVTLRPYAAQGQTTNGETITFLNGSTVVGTATLSSGGTELFTTSLPAGTDSLTAKYAGDANFNAATSSAISYHVSQASPAITWNPLPSDTYTGKGVGTAVLDATSNRPGTFAYTASLNGGPAVTITAASVLAAGTYTLTASFTPTDTTDFTTASTSLQYVVAPAPLTVVPVNETRMYGTANPALPATVTGALNGDVFTVTGATAATTTSPVGSYAISYTVSGSNLANYTVTAPTGTLTITQAAPAITWATPAAITYGTALSAAQLNATASTAGTFTYTPAAGLLLGAGTQTLSVTFTPTDATDYSSATGMVILVVNKATPTITWTAPAAITYGTTLSSAQLNAAASTNGSFVYTPAAGTVLGAGRQALSLTFTPADSTDYVSTTATNAIVVNQAGLTVLAANATRMYGSPNPVFSASVSGAVNNDAFLVSATSSATASSAVGTYAIVPAVSGADLANYTVTLVNGTLTITPATLTVVPANATRVYGAANPALTGTVTGALNGDVFTVTGTTTATATSPVGQYPISYTVNGANVADYSVVPATGTLTITTATPGITWTAPAAITYGTVLSAAQLNATTPTPGSFVYSPAIGTALSAGTQTLSVTFTPTDTTDYVKATVSVSITVNKASLTVAANNATRAYGLANPVFTGTVVGAVNGDSFSEGFSTSANSSSIAGTYAIVPTVTGTDLADYTVTVNNGVLTISQAATTTAFALSNQNATLTATVTSTSPGVPTGTVGFYEGGTLIGSGTLGNGTASYVAGLLPSGDATFSAQYSGDADFAPSASTPTIVLAVTPSSTSLTVVQTGSVSDTLGISVIPGYAGTVQFSCTGLPQYATCSFQGSPVAFASPTTTGSVVMRIQTGVSASVVQPQLPGAYQRLRTVLALLWMPGLLCGALAGRRRGMKIKLLVVLLLCGIGTALTGCGSSPAPPTLTPDGTSTVQVVATGTGGISQSTSVSLTVN